ncbi:TDT family transporter [Dietzia sp. 179-F 9C3 NHS]|uniref:TDT family transporter n=1 Tax=Dietzia sp. 179-F 9C3 NHS TaxID=3374295 RepID=UPI003879F37D
MSTALATRPVRPAPRPALPAAGPAWFPSVMGTGILSTLLAQHHDRIPGALPAASVLFVVGWVLVLGLSTAFGVRCARRQESLSGSLRDHAQAPAWGTTSMGLLAMGSATATVVPLVAPGWGSAAIAVDAALWTLGTLLGVYTTVSFVWGLRAHELGAPAPPWGLPVVPPMVSATTGATLVDHLAGRGAQVALLTVLVGCFLLALVPGLAIFARAYHHHLRREALPDALLPSLWIPLGVVGQSTAAAQSIALRMDRLATSGTGEAARALADGYGAVMILALGVPLTAYATVGCLRGAARRMPFSPGWWAMTFPVGTLALGAGLLGRSLSSPAGEAADTALTLTLVGTWTLCATASLVAVGRAAAHVRSRRARPQAEE